MLHVETAPLTDGSSILAEFFQALESRHIAYCVVGDCSSLPHVPDNDVDIVCAKGARAQIGEIIDALTLRHGGARPQLIWHASEAICHVLYFPMPGGRSAYIKLDVCENYIVDGRMLTATWLLEGRRKVERPSITFHVGAPDREFAYYLVKKISKGEAQAPARRHLATLMAADPAGCRSILQQFWPIATAALVERALVSEDWTEISGAIESIRKTLYDRLPRCDLAARLTDLARAASRLLRPTGFVIAVLGPDGAGKSTLLERLRTRMTGFDGLMQQFHLAPPLHASRATRGPVIVDPHGAPPRGGLASTLKLLYLAIVYNLGWLVSVWLPVRKSAMIFFDRYFQDILADPLRYRNGAPSWVVRAFARLTPSPHLFLILDVPPDVARARKAEVSVEESERQFAAYRALCRELPNACLIDAAKSPSDVANACEEEIVRAMERRYAPT